MTKHFAINQNHDAEGSRAAAEEPSFSALPALVPPEWPAWLDRGWHGVRTGEWAGLYLPAKLDADLRFLSHLVKLMPDFDRVAQRLQREVVGDLIRMQHLLPWHDKKRPQFFREKRGSEALLLKDREHAFPVSQVKSLVLMAMQDNDVEQARKRLIYFWLVPTVLCTSETHKRLPKRCSDFRYPYLRYASVEGLRLERFDGAEVDPATYDAYQLLDELQLIDQLKPIVSALDGLTLPTPEAEEEFTRKMVHRGKSKG